MAKKINKKTHEPWTSRTHELIGTIEAQSPMTRGQIDNDTIEQVLTHEFDHHKVQTHIIANKNPRNQTHNPPEHNHKIKPMYRWSTTTKPLRTIASHGSERRDVMLQFDWLCDVCGCVMSPTSGIYWVELSFINNYKEPQLWLVLLRYSADVASAFPWVVTYGIRAGLIIPCGFRDTTLQSGP